MKKVLAICFVMVMVMTMSITAFAASSNFISSPSVTPGPTIVDSTNNGEDCDGKVIVTPYSERDSLDDDSKKDIEDAYNNITNSEDITKLVDGLTDVAEKAGVSNNDLSVKDLFDVDYSGCTKDHKHGDFNIKLNGEPLNNFVALVYHDGDGWKTVDNAKVTDGKYLSFTAEAMGPYAIVVSKSAISPETSDNTTAWSFAAIMLVSAVAFVFASKKARA